jgi:hypothetical protein
LTIVNRPTFERVNALLSYDAATGVFIWRVRPETYGQTIGTNVKFAGRVAGGFNSRGYRQIPINAKPIVAHRIAWLLVTGEWPDREIDHINGIKDDNRFENLRLATRAQNASNKGRTSRNTSGFKGVQWDSRNKKWRALITVNNRQIFLGRHNDIEAAKAAYANAAIKYHGEFARVA